jgi:hypothetical protein
MSEYVEENLYKNGKIYKIINYIDDEIYVGSTVQTLEQRWEKHKYYYHMCYFGNNARKLYMHMQKLHIKHFKIELIENYPCKGKGELHAREAYWMKELKASLNSVIPGGNPDRFKRIPMECVCGASIDSLSKNSHEKTKKHRNYITRMKNHPPED